MQGAARMALGEANFRTELMARFNAELVDDIVAQGALLAKA